MIANARCSRLPALARHPAARPARRRALAASGLALALGLAVTGCTGEDTAPAGPSDDSAVEQVVYLTSFGSFGRDAYPYVAQDLGFFDDASLDVQVQPGTGIDNLKLLAAGDAHFAAVDLNALAVTIGAADTVDYTAVAAIHQLAPEALMAVDPGITMPQDLAGRTVALVQGAVGELLFDGYAGQVGLDPGSVEIVHAEPANLPSVLASGSAHAIDQFVFGRPLVEAAVGGRDVHVLEYSDYLPDLYGIVIATTPSIAAEQPELVERFLNALLRGLAHSLNHPAQAGQILADQLEEDEQYAEVAAAELEIMDSYSRQPATPLGHIDEIRVVRSIALLESVGAINQGVLEADDIVDFDLVPTQDPQ